MERTSDAGVAQELIEIVKNVAHSGECRDGSMGEIFRERGPYGRVEAATRKAMMEASEEDKGKEFERMIEGTLKEVTVNQANEDREDAGKVVRIVVYSHSRVRGRTAMFRDR